jgi:hypothetical protein
MKQKHWHLNELRKSKMAPAAAIAVLLGLSTGACGRSDGPNARSAGRTSSTTETTAAHVQPDSVRGRLLGDGDRDNPEDIDGDEYEDGDPDSDVNRATGRYHDSDDSPVTGAGRAANAAEGRAVSSVAERYYAALAGGNGTAACSLMPATLAGTLAEAYGGPGGSAYLRGAKDCPTIVAREAAHLRSALSGRVRITGVRLLGAGSEAYALVGSATLPAGYIKLQREAGRWRVATLASVPLP